MEFVQEIKIPKERIPVLIGTKGNTKKEIQKKTNVKLNIDSELGLVTLIGDDGLYIHTAKEIIQAIGRGFNPEIAFLLLDDSYAFDQVNMADYAKTKKRLYEIRSRIIGSKGRARKTIESLSNVEICIYGKTVGIIGKQKDVEIARSAIEKLLSGSQHSKTYAFLERQIKKN